MARTRLGIVNLFRRIGRFERVACCLALLLLLGTAGAAAKTPIRLVTYGAETAIERWARIAAAFEKDRPDYSLEFEIVPLSDYPTKVSVMVAAGSPPDVFQTIAQYKVRWGEQGLLMDLRPYWERSQVASSVEVLPFMMEAVMYDGAIVGVPWDFSSMAITLNVDAINEAGLAVPDNNWTVEDYRMYALRLTRPDEGIYGSNLGASSGISNWIWAVNFTGEGWLDRSRTEVLVESPANIEMLEYWLDLIDRRAVPPPGVAPSRNQWTGGYGMWGGWSHWGERMGTDATYDWAMVSYPAGPGGDKNFAHGHMMSMASNAPNPDRGWVFLEWLLTPEGQRAVVQLDARQPIVGDPELWTLFFSTVPTEKQQMMYDLVFEHMYGMNRLHIMEYWTSWPDVERVMNQQLGAIFRGQVPPTTGMTTAAAQIRALLAAE